MEKGAEHYVLTLVGVAKYNCNFCLKANIQSHLSLRNEYEWKIPAFSFTVSNDFKFVFKTETTLSYQKICFLLGKDKERLIKISCRE